MPMGCTAAGKSLSNTRQVDNLKADGTEKGPSSLSPRNPKSIHQIDQLEKKGETNAATVEEEKVLQVSQNV